MKQTAVEWLVHQLITENEVTLKGENYKLFELAKEMPLCPIGSQVVMAIDVGGREYLRVNEITMPIDIAMEEPDWFTPISKEEHKKICHENVIKFLMEDGKSKEEAEEMWSRFIGS